MRICVEKYPSGVKEERDALAHDWYVFLQNVLPNAVGIPVPNIEDMVQSYIANIAIDGIILTGGNSIGTMPRRDLTEKHLLQWAVQKQLPVLGVCRGAQMLNNFLGGTLSEVSISHRANPHQIILKDASLATILVNSYHDYGIAEKDLAVDCMPLAHAQDGSVEAFKHKKLPWFGLMWHPERDIRYDSWDILQIQNLFKEQTHG